MFDLLPLIFWDGASPFKTTAGVLMQVSTMETVT